MPRGNVATAGQTRISKNGYHYTRTPDGWKLTHRLIAEQLVDRELEPDEIVQFKDGNRNNIDPSNLQVVRKKQGSLKQRLARLDAKIAELQAQRDLLALEL